MPLLLLVIMMMAILGSDATTGCAPPPATGTAGLASLNANQIQIARNGVVIGRQRGEPENVILAELAAAEAESGFRNLSNPNVPASQGYTSDGEGTNLDSVGPHQIRAGIWAATLGGMAGLMNPVTQINWFYSQADKTPGAASMDPASLAQAVENSAHPERYGGTALALAQQVYAAYADVTATPNDATADTATQPQGCGQGTNGQPVPAPAGSFGAAVIAAAVQWIGKADYAWGGGTVAGPSPGGQYGTFDCSGLTMYAVYQASGGRIRLAHNTQIQQDDPRAAIVPYANREPGDLVYFTKAGASESHHVGIYLGQDNWGNDMVLNAPDYGQKVKIEPLTDWKGERWDFRRFGINTPPGVDSRA
ncbi:C40 family peptidase [Nocardia miyunensis]|uniref:C40 family peptidase n=1 Tax=Nocardia miyunensis TaxID=282684 RepID=UPI001FE141FF|nr:C40 family peptidase [Nocardia miyunensis]